MICRLFCWTDRHFTIFSRFFRIFRFFFHDCFFCGFAIRFFGFFFWFLVCLSFVVILLVPGLFSVGYFLTWFWIYGVATKNNKADAKLNKLQVLQVKIAFKNDGWVEYWMLIAVNPSNFTGLICTYYDEHVAKSQSDERLCVRIFRLVACLKAAASAARSPWRRGKTKKAEKADNDDKIDTNDNLEVVVVTVFSW